MVNWKSLFFYISTLSILLPLEEKNKLIQRGSKYWREITQISNKEQDFPKFLSPLGPLRVAGQWIGPKGAGPPTDLSSPD